MVSESGAVRSAASEKENVENINNRRKIRRALSEKSISLLSQSIEMEDEAPLSPTLSQISQSSAAEVQNDEPTDYQKGAIKYISIRNLQTYDWAEVFPGPNINVIIGPNGTGKSTIVASMVLGLGGKTSVLGKQKDVADYIRHGQNEAEIIVVLARGKSNGNDLPVRRIININDAGGTRKVQNKFYEGAERKNADDLPFKEKYHWKLCSQDSIQKKIEKLNIQVDNVCQIMPQDKIYDFSQKNPQERLREMERLLGDDLLQTHKDLIDFKAEAQKKQNKRDAVQSELDEKNKQKAGLDEEVKRLELCEDLRTEIEYLEKKKVWTAYNEARRKALEANELLKEKKAEFDEHKKRHKPLENEIAKLQVAADQVAEQYKASQSQFRQKERQRVKKASDVDEKTEEIKAGFDEIDSLEAKKQKVENKIEALQRKIREIETELEKLPAEEAIQKDLTDIAKELAADRKVINQKKRERAIIDTALNEKNREKLQMERVIEKKRGEADRYMDVLRNSSNRFEKMAYDAHVWVQQNQSRFRLPVLGPIVWHLKTRDPLHQGWLEKALGRRTLNFVVQSKEDFALLGQQFPGVDISKIEPGQDVPPADIDKNGLAQQGIHILSDLVECGDVIQRWLNVVGGLNKIGVHDRTNVNDEWVTKVLRSNPKVRVMYTKDTMFQYSSSRYDPSQSYTQIQSFGGPLRPRFSRTDTAAETQDLEQSVSMLAREVKDLRQQVAACDNQLSAMETNHNHLTEKKRRVFGMKKQRTEKIRSISDKQRQISDLQEVDIEGDRRNIQKRIKKLNADRLKLASMCVENLMEMTKISLKRTKEALKLDDFKTRIQLLRDKLLNTSESMQRLENELEDLKRTYQQLHREAQQKQRRAKEVAPATDPVEKAKMMRVFEDLPDTEEEIDAKIAENTARVANTQSNPNAKRDRDRIAKEVDRLQRELDEIEQDLEEQENGIIRRRDNWIQQLNQAVKDIDKQFSESFRDIDCRGEVRLLLAVKRSDKIVTGKNEDDPDDYAAWGLDLRVAFRRESGLSSLNPATQSGGEKSVTTMFFLSALQSISSAAACPFRLVDEINQGMDSRNERKTFDAMAKSARLSQFFLISPKLLPGLNFTPRMRVSIIFNGPYMTEQQGIPDSQLLSQLPTSASPSSRKRGRDE